MSNLEVVKDLLAQAGGLIEMHYAGLFTTNETLLSLIDIVERAVDAHAEGGTIKAGEIDENTGLRIEQNAEAPSPAQHANLVFVTLRFADPPVAGDLHD